MTPEQRHQVIQERLTAGLSPTFLEIKDESHLHVGHAGAKTGASHFAVIIASPQFAGLSLIEQHRKVYGLLQDLIPKEIHALKISAKE